MTPEALARPNGTGWHQCDRELRIGGSTYFCSGDNGHGGWHSFMFDDEALAALTPAPAKGARCKHGYPMTCPHYDCRPTTPPPEPDGEEYEAQDLVRRWYYDQARGASLRVPHKDRDALVDMLDAALARARGKG